MTDVRQRPRLVWLLVALVLLDAPVWTWFASFALGEAFVPNVGSLIRARWAHVLPLATDAVSYTNLTLPTIPSV